MTDFLTLVPPAEARTLLFSHLDPVTVESEEVDTLNALGRVAAEDVYAPGPLPEFTRSSVDGYAVKAKNTYGATESMPVYLKLIGEVKMGSPADLEVTEESAAIIHTGGMVPPGADAVVMLEYVQETRGNEIEVARVAAVGENTIRVGEDVQSGQLILPKGKRIRPSEIGGLSALGITNLRVAKRVRVGIISTGDEVVPPDAETRLGQVRDVNSSTLASLVVSKGGYPTRYGIVPDRFDELLAVSSRALNESDVVVITAGSSASVRDMTADIINRLGTPGVLVHGINTKPGKPTILGVCQKKAVIGLPGNPVSALVNGLLFLVPLLEKLSGEIGTEIRPTVSATLTINLPSQAGREDWQPVKLTKAESGFLAEPVFGKSNLIFSLSAADGLICIEKDVTGLSAGEKVDVLIF